MVFFFQGNCTSVKNTEFLFCDLQICTTYSAHAQLSAFSFQPSFIIIMVKCFSLGCDFQRRFNALSFWYGLKRQVCDSKNSTLSNRKNNIFPFGGTDSSSMYLTSQVMSAWYFMLIAASGHYCSILFHHLFKSKITQSILFQQLKITILGYILIWEWFTCLLKFSNIIIYICLES